MRAEVYGFLGTRMKEREGITYHGVQAVVGLDTGACRFQGGVGTLTDAICPMVTTLPRAEIVMDE
jgi:hypothetical protein